MLHWLIDIVIGIILGKIICRSSNWQHIQRLKITILGANWQFFRLERIAKCSYFILSTQKYTFYWFVMKIKKFLLPGLFPLGNKYFGVFVLNGLKAYIHHTWVAAQRLNGSTPIPDSIHYTTVYAIIFAVLARCGNSRVVNFTILLMLSLL